MRDCYRAAARFYPSLLLMLCCGLCAFSQTWERLGPEGGNVISLATNSNGSVFLGTADGHVYVSQDGAAHWELRGRAGSRLDGVIQQLLVDARSPQRVFAALWFQDPAAGGGVFVSEDGARTWRLSGLQGEAVRTLEQSRSQPEMLTAGTRTGIFRSNDSGLNWQRISPYGDQELRNIDSLAIDPSDPRVIYAGTYHLPWKTADGGKTWTAIPAGMIDDSDVMSLHIDAQNSSRIFASACSGIYRSENGGVAWTKLQGIPYSSRRTQSIAQDPHDPHTLYAGTTEGLWLTRDSGETWTRVSPREWVINAVAPIPTSSGNTRVVLGTEDQGILVTDDSATTFRASNAGFSHHVVAALIGDSRDPQRMLARVVGSGPSLLESRDSGTSWHALRGEDPASGIERLFATESGWWASFAGGGVAHYDDVSAKWVRFHFFPALAPRSRQRPVRRPIKPKASVSNSDPWVSDVRTSETRVYVASVDGLWIGELSKPLLRPATFPGLKGALHSIEIAPGGGEIWVTSDETILHSRDAGKSWTNETREPELEPILWTQLVLAKERRLLFLGTQKGVYRLSLDTNSRWQLLQSGLPAVPTNRPWASATQIVIPARKGGLYFSNDGGDTWQRLDTTLEDGIFTGITGDGHGGLITGSRTEGLLHWIPPSSSK